MVPDVVSLFNGGGAHPVVHMGRSGWGSGTIYCAASVQGKHPSLYTISPVSGIVFLKIPA